MPVRMSLWVPMVSVGMAVGCVGNIGDARRYNPVDPAAVQVAGQSGAVAGATVGGGAPATSLATTPGGWLAAGTPAAGAAGQPALGVAAPSGTVTAPPQTFTPPPPTFPVTQPPSAGSAATPATGGADLTMPRGTSGASVGTGSIAQPAIGPAPIEAAKLTGAPFVLVKNWDFGANGTIRNIDELIEEFQFHDQYGTIANGTNYGAVTVAPNAATAVTANNLGLPNNRQPVEDPARPYREFTDETIKTYVRPLSATATSVSATAHNAGNGSFTAKWKLPTGGSRLKQDLLWESRVRIPVPVSAFWFSIWAAGTKWQNGAEMDVVESFGTPNIGTGAKAFHVNSVGGQDQRAYKSWPSELQSIGVPMADRDLANWHTFTWIYLRDDSYQVYFDDYLVQQGKLIWTLGGGANGQVIDMMFLFDFSWGHTQVSDVNVSLPASNFPMTYELDYSRIYMRN